MSERSQKRLSGTEGSTTALPESFTKVLKATAKLYNSEPDDDVLKIWKDLLNYCSEAEAIEALKQWQYQGAYFPKPAEILQLVANARDAARYTDAGPGCNLCSDGWIILNSLAKPSDYEVKPCECRTNASLRANRIKAPQRGHGFGWEEIMDECKRLGLGAELSKRFANGNPRLNLQLAQARALMGV